VSRIIGGMVGSLRLKGPAKATRPTSDRVKESVFSILESRDVLEGAVVVDLFAGTGALGLEAASRGARSVTLVERDQAAAKVCKENLENVQQGLLKAGQNPKLELRVQSVEKCISSLVAADLIFVDPPYEMSNLELSQIVSKLKIRDFGIIVVERSSKSGSLKLAEPLGLVRESSYGDSTVSFIHKS
jgi:16S rRNA (guanine966-N2)-methyltransferase